jgi:hypothetical protein
MLQIITSKFGKPVRLSDERWAHITEEHSEVAGRRVEVLDAIAAPDRILQGNANELLAVKEIDTGKDIVVVYKELAVDGFIITAFLTRRRKSLDRKKRLWP